MGKFKVGDRVRRVKPSDWPHQYGEVGEEYPVLAVNRDGSIVVIAGEPGADASAFELVTPAITIETGKFYRTASGAVTGRVSKGDTGFEAVVDGKVRIYDAAGGHVHGDSGLDIVEQWAPRVGERVRYRNKLFGEATVIEILDDRRVKVDTCGPFKICTELLESIEPLPVATQPAAPALKIEAGRYYRTRDGRKVGPMGICLWGGFYDTARRVTGQRWEANGTFIKGQISNLDLIAEWQDTPAAPIAAQVDAIAEEYGPAVAASKPKFKVGDVVMDTASHDKDRAVVKDVNGSQITIEWMGSGGLIGEWPDEDFELVTTAAIPSTTAAIVALIENGQPKPAGRPYVHTSEEKAATEARRLAGVHKGKQFGVFVLTTTAEEAKPTYHHKWQRLAAEGQKIEAIKELRLLTGMRLKPAKDVVENFIDDPYGQAA